MPRGNQVAGGSEHDRGALLAGNFLAQEAQRFGRFLKMAARFQQRGAQPAAAAATRRYQTGGQIERGFGMAGRDGPGQVLQACQVRRRARCLARTGQLP